MRCILTNKYASWLPSDFDALNFPDAEHIVQQWGNRCNTGKLTFEWCADECGVYFWRRGVRRRFCTFREG